MCATPYEGSLVFVCTAPSRKRIFIVYYIDSPISNRSTPWKDQIARLPSQELCPRHTPGLLSHTRGVLGQTAGEQWAGNGSSLGSFAPILLHHGPFCRTLLAQKLASARLACMRISCMHAVKQSRVRQKATARIQHSTKPAHRKQRRNLRGRCLLSNIQKPHFSSCNSAPGIPFCLWHFCSRFRPPDQQLDTIPISLFGKKRTVSEIQDWVACSLAAREQERFPLLLCVNPHHLPLACT
jgi:hypothetical protein